MEARTPGGGLAGRPADPLAEDETGRAELLGPWRRHADRRRRASRPRRCGCARATGGQADRSTRRPCCTRIACCTGGQVAARAAQPGGRRGASTRAGEGAWLPDRRGVGAARSRADRHRVRAADHGRPVLRAEADRVPCAALARRGTWMAAYCASRRTCTASAKDEATGHMAGGCTASGSALLRRTARSVPSRCRPSWLSSFTCTGRSRRRLGTRRAPCGRTWATGWRGGQAPGQRRGNPRAERTILGA